MPAWLDPIQLAAPTFFLWVVVAYFLTIMGGEWISDALCTLGLALKIEPLFVGIIVTTAVGVVPMIALVLIFCATAHAPLAYGTLLGASWGTSLLPLALAGLSIPVGVGERWVRVDLPLYIIYFTVFIYFCLEVGAYPLKGFVVLAAAVIYLIFRYLHGKEARYGLSTFGRNFIFGASVFGTLFRFLVGLCIMAVGCFFLYILTMAAIARWHLPAMPLGFAAAFPLCFTEITFALSAVKKGQGELILGRGVGLSTLIVLAGAWVLNHYQLPDGAESFSPVFFILLIGLFVMWLFLRLSKRLWRWQAALLLTLTLLGLAVAWLQGYGYLAFLKLPKMLG